MSISKLNQGNSASQVTNFENMMHPPGSIIGNRYQIIQKLGSSETGKIYLAKDLQATADGRCVVEQLSPIFSDEANWRIIKQYLLNEIIVLERLGDHPQIPQFRDHFTEHRQFYLVREYIDGDNLEQEVERKVYTEADVVYLIQDTLRILDFIHKTNVIHRNVQPVHLIRRKQDNKFVLIDFGAIQEIESTTINLQGEFLFDRYSKNCPYIAPEQKSGKSHFSSDIYALGKTAIYALTGKSPQELEQTNLYWRSQCQISSKLEVILNKMMSSEIEDRYASTLEVLYDLRPLLRIKQVIGGRYLITRYLGGKKEIETYLADNRHRQYQSPCLVKQIELPGINNDGKYRLPSNFTEELLVLERLGYHEQIPQLWDHFVEHDKFYLVQEYFQGDNLADKIAQQDLTTPQIIQILVSALSVLSFIHQNQIIHRNIKPSNLLIDDQTRQVILTDFGILADIKTLSINTTEHGSNSEQKNYCSPEQIAGRPTISSDLYALGMSAIEAFTKVKPANFKRNQQTGGLLWTQNIDLDRRLIKIINKMVQLNLGQRYQSADKALNDLQKINSFANFQDKKSLKPGSLNFPRTAKSRLTKLPILIGLLGIGFLLGSLEFAFPFIRPTYYWYQGHKILPEQPQKALNTFTKAIDLKPKSAIAWSGRGDALSLLERHPEALEAYAEAVELNANNASNWKKQGHTFFRLEKFTEAIASYDRALELEPEDGKIYNVRGKALYQLQQYEAALSMQDLALELDPLNAQYWSDRGLNLWQLGRSYEALTAFNRAQAIEPNNLQLWQDKFLVLKALKRPLEADRVFREVSNSYLQVIQQQPPQARTLLAQGDFFAKAQLYQKAVNLYDQALEIKPNMYQAWLAKGKALTQLGENQAALDSLEQAWQIRPQSYIALQAQGLVYQNQSDFLSAIALYDQGIEINPNYAPLWRDRGLALNQQQQYSQALESLSKANSLASNNAKTWQGLAQAWNGTGESQRALSAINRAIEINPEDPNLWSLKGLIYINNAQYDKACDTYRQSRTVASDSQIILNSMMQNGCKMD